MIEEIGKLKKELERTKYELSILYEISNAMRTTLKLDEILYIILTGVTAHFGLGFNRAALFLVNEKEKIIEGRLGIGPETGEEAGRVWTQIEQEKMNLDDLISVSGFAAESGFNKQICHLKLPLQEKNGGLMAFCVSDGMPLYLTKETLEKYAQDHVVQLLKNEELVIVPLKLKDKVTGLILADNFVTKNPITKENIRMLTMLANQAGLAIENSRLYEKTVIRSHSDYLTGLWNHGYFQLVFQAELEKVKAVRAPLSLLMVDIDDFKVYNDTLGHQLGDDILKELALLIRNQSRRMDYVCRYGGEEFTIILPHTEKKEAFIIAERLRSDIERYSFIKDGVLPNKKLTVSIGIASFPENGESASELISFCDKMLYQAKRKGKNTTCC